MNQPVDRIYTPSHLIGAALGAISLRSVQTIADYTCGHGNLLLAGHERYRGATVVGADTNAVAIRSLQRRFPHWILSCGNFLNASAFSRSSAARVCADLALLNPPFTCRGQKRWAVELDGDLFHTSTSAAFMARSLAHVREGGQLISFMPEGFLYSAKDAKFRSHLERMYSLNIVDVFDDPGFEDARVRVALVSILKSRRRRSFRRTCPGDYAVSGGDACRVTVVRGGLPVHEAKRLPDATDGIPYLHTKMLVNFPVGLPPVPRYSRGVVRGPGVVFPRVGVPSSRHIRVLPRSMEIQLSDCVILLGTRTVRDARGLYDVLQDNLGFLQSLYVGTGARHITMSRLEIFLSRLNVERVGAEQ